MPSGRSTSSSRGRGRCARSWTDKIAQEPWKDNVTLLGHRTDVPNLLASLDVLVLPSYAHEGIPQIILQAQAMARPVVATTIGGIPEVVEDGVTGLLVAPRDADALAEKIAALLDDPATRRAAWARTPRTRKSRRNTASMRWGRGCWRCMRSRREVEGPES